MTRTLIDTVCFNDHRATDVWRVDGHTPPCVECGSPTERLFQGSSTAPVIQDSIEGGIDIKHGLCYADGTPRRFYSKSEIAKAAKAKGLVNIVTHIGDPGSDRSKQTQRFI